MYSSIMESYSTPEEYAAADREEQFKQIISTPDPKRAMFSVSECSLHLEVVVGSFTHLLPSIYAVSALAYVAQLCGQPPFSD